VNSGIMLVSCSSRHARHVARESGQILADEMREGEKGTEGLEGELPCVSETAGL
jgi:hypothetical protein